MRKKKKKAKKEKKNFIFFFVFIVKRRCFVCVRDMTETKLLGCFLEDKLLEDRIFERKRTFVLSESQSVEFDHVDNFETYLELLVTREILNEEKLAREQCSKRQKTTLKNMLQVIEDVQEVLCNNLNKIPKSDEEDL